MRRDVKTINTGIRRKSEKGAVSGRSVSHQYVGFYKYTETLGYGDGQLPRMCRCVKKKNEKGYFFLSVQHVAQSTFTICRTGNTMPIQFSLKRCNMGRLGGLK